MLWIAYCQLVEESLYFGVNTPPITWCTSWSSCSLTISLMANDVSAWHRKRPWPQQDWQPARRQVRPLRPLSVSAAASCAQLFDWNVTYLPSSFVATRFAACLHKLISLILSRNTRTAASPNRWIAGWVTDSVRGVWVSWTGKIELWWVWFHPVLQWEQERMDKRLMQHS